MYNELAKNITMESAPVRQTHYTTKIHQLVDFINIFQHILKSPSKLINHYIK